MTFLSKLVTVLPFKAFCFYSKSLNGNTASFYELFLMHIFFVLYTHIFISTIILSTINNIAPGIPRIPTTADVSIFKPI